VLDVWLSLNYSATSRGESDTASFSPNSTTSICCQFAVQQVVQ